MLEDKKYYSTRFPATISEQELDGVIARMPRSADNADMSEPESIKHVFASPENEEARAVEAARCQLRLFKKRGQMFSEAEFSDPTWMILLYLFTNGNKPASVRATCDASGAASTTALRYIARLEGAGLIVRNPHPFDLRTIELRLTAKAKQGLIELFG